MCVTKTPKKLWCGPVVVTWTSLTFDSDPGFLSRFPSISVVMRSPVTSNQRRRSPRNRQPSSTVNQNSSYAFRPKLKYENSCRVGTTGLFVVSSRKRRAPTAEQVEVKRLRQIAIKVKQVSLVSLRHEVVSLWKHGMHTENLQFGPKNAKQIE